MGCKEPSDHKSSFACMKQSHGLAQGSRRNLQDILRDIRGRDVRLRMAAIEVLRKSPTKHRNTILQLANDVERDVRVLGCGLIGATKPAGAIKILLEKIQDREPSVREAACAALGNFRAPRAVTGLAEALHDEPWIAYAAACSLGEIAGKRAHQQLMNAFRHENDVLKATAACQALLQWDDAGVADEIATTVRGWHGRKRDRFLRIILEQGGKRILDRLRHVFGDDLLDHLHCFVDSECKTPLRLIRVIAEFANRQAVCLILKELAKRDPDEEDFPEILGFLSDLHAIWKDQPEEYLSAPQEGFTLPMIRACAVTCTRISESALRDIFSQSSIDTKREISRSLTLIADPSIQFVEGLLLDGDDHIRGDAAEAAAFFGMDRLSPRIEELAQTGYSDTRKKAFRSLCILDPLRAQALAEEFVLHGGGEEKKIYLSGVELMGRELNHRLIKRLLHSRENRIAAITVIVLGRLIEHDGRYLDLIGEMLRRRKALSETLEVIKENRLTSFQPELLKLLEELRDDLWARYQTLSALAAMEDQNLFDVFAAGLRHEHSLIRIASIKALSRLRRTRAAELISPFIKDGDADLRRAAQAALNTLMSGNQAPSLPGTY